MQSAASASGSLDLQWLKEMSDDEEEALTAAPFLQQREIKQARKKSHMNK